MIRANWGMPEPALPYPVFHIDRPVCHSIVHKQLHAPDILLHVAAKEGFSDYDDGGTCRYDGSDICECDIPVHLDRTIRMHLIQLFPEFRNPAQRFRDEGLSLQPRLDRHQMDHIRRLQTVFSIGLKLSD